MIGPQHGQATNLIGQSGLCKPVVSQPLQLSTHLAGGWERAHEQYELSSLHFTMRSIAPNVQPAAISFIQLILVLVESWFSVGLSSVLVSSGALDQVLVESWFRPWRGDKSRALLGLGPGEETSPGLGFEYVMGGSQGTGLGPITGISSTGHV